MAILKFWSFAFLAAIFFPAIICRHYVYQDSETEEAIKRKYLLEKLQNLFDEGKVDVEEDTESEAVAWLKKTNKESAKNNGLTANLEFTYETNISKANAKVIEDNDVIYSQWRQDVASDAKQFLKTLVPEETSPDVIRQLTLFSHDVSLKDKNDIRKHSSIVNKMQEIYDTGKVCRDAHKKSTCLPLDPDLTEIMSKSRDWDELLWAWKGWRDATGPKIRPLYSQFIELENKGAKTNGYKDMGEFWRLSNFEDPKFDEKVDALYNQVKPMYEQLHAYVRRKLIQQYPDHKIDPTGPIPAHLLGNMWAQSWDLIQDILLPYPNAPSFDVTKEMKKQGYTPKQMFETAEAFFTSIGLNKMTNEFWEKSMITKPTDGREVQCHASAEDFHNASDYRIKMCTQVTMDDLYTIHHEMGHVEYYMQYSHQPDIYRNGANAGFHEAVGDTIALSVTTPEHLKKIKLLKSTHPNEELRQQQDINFLLKIALQKLAFLPFGLLIDKWRWEVFRKNINKNNYNQRWWDLRLKYQGLMPPVKRTETDFDPGAKFHVPANVPYIRYFVSFLIQFQFHKALCDASGHQGPVHRCDIYESKEAGNKLRSLLSLGSSKPWPEAMKVLTGKDFIDTSAIEEYFKPLMDWLKNENEKHGEVLGWKESSASETVDSEKIDESELEKIIISKLSKLIDKEGINEPNPLEESKPSFEFLSDNELGNRNLYSEDIDNNWK